VEDNSQTDTIQSGDISQKGTVCPERLEDQIDNISLEEVNTYWLSEQGDWETRGW
jgi:hypothetical protein